MPDIKFWLSGEIKRSIAAVERAGVRVKSIEIHLRKIIIFTVEQSEKKPPEPNYSQWKAAQHDIR